VLWLATDNGDDRRLDQGFELLGGSLGDRFPLGRVVLLLVWLVQGVEEKLRG